MSTLYGEAFPGAGTAAGGSHAAVPLTKRFLDRFAAALLLVAVAPLLAVLVVLTKATSSGPGIYTQTRLGHRGRTFRIYKIRTMHHDCERETGPRWSTDRDPRATAVGRLLRRTHLDELPQLWNVLRGDMSLVGPRPERPEIAAELRKALPYYDGRLAVLPGLTGLAQVQLPPDGCVDDVRRKLQYDLHYATEANLLLDLKILAATIFHLAGLSPERTRVLASLPSWESVSATSWVPALPADRHEPAVQPQPA